MEKVAEFEAAYGIPLDIDTYHDYEALPIIMAQSIVLSPAPAEMSANSHLYCNQPIALVGEVEEIWSFNAFVIEEEGLLCSLRLSYELVSGKMANQLKKC